MFVDARGAERAAAGSGGDLAALEVADELAPFLVGGDAVFLAWPHRSPAGQEGQVGLDGLVRIDGLVAKGDVDVLMAGDDLRDVRGQTVQAPALFSDHAPEAGACCPQVGLKARHSATE
ncbi:hypothetical protein, partial [Streptomyces sp. H34-S4]|uniref:hypothetical protein n=1 Tax=Streptomyces sp. H34-S4 TaxID=2996463 RepID=UPI00227137E0